MKTLKMTFSTAGKSNMVISLDNPKEGLTLDEVKQEAAKLIPVLVTRSGAEVKELISATIATTTEEPLS